MCAQHLKTTLLNSPLKMSTFKVTVTFKRRKVYVTTTTGWR